MTNLSRLLSLAMGFALVACAQPPGPPQTEGASAQEKTQQSEEQKTQQGEEQKTQQGEEQKTQQGEEQKMQPSSKKPRITVEVETQAVEELSPTEQLNVSAAAARLLHHVDDSRKVIKDNRKQAQEEVEKALLLVRIIEKVTPERKVSTTIKADDLTYRDVERVKPSLVSIYDEVETVSVLAPLLRAREEAPDEGGIPVVDESEIQYTEILLDVEDARSGLETANKHLSENKLNKADMVLGDVQSQVILHYVESDVPLVEARENLILARIRARQDEAKGVEAALKAAADALGDYSKLAREPRRKEAKALSEEIRSFAPKAEKDLTGAVNKIEGWWSKVVGWGR